MLTTTSCSVDNAVEPQAIGSTGRMNRGATGNGRELLEYRKGEHAVTESDGMWICTMEESSVIPMISVCDCEGGRENKDESEGTTSVCCVEVE
jgi:hypothetical protein